MYEANKISPADKENFYQELLQIYESVIADEPDWLANMANISALLNHHFHDINWVGFYLYKNKELILGPFQGKPACTHIAMGKGVCGTAAASRKTLVVPDVHAFPGHIACDIASRSEIVVPIVSEANLLLGVLDIDSPYLARFDEGDAKGLETIVTRIAALPGWPLG